MRSAATASARPIIRTTPLGSGPRPRMASSWCRWARPILALPTKNCCRSIASSGATPRRNSARFGTSCTSRTRAWCWRSLSKACNARPGINPAWRCGFRASTGCAGTSRRARPTGWKRWSGVSRRKQASIPPRRAAIDANERVPHLDCNDYNARPLRARETEMPNDTRELPAANEGLTRFLGGSPLMVAFRLILLSILVGVVLAAIGFDPWNILKSIELLFQRLWNLGFDAVNWLWRYFLLGAVIVIPVWLLTRMFGTPRGR